LVEQAASAAKSMEQQAQSLIAEIAFFRAQDEAKQSASAGVTHANVQPMRAAASARPTARPRATERPMPMAKVSGGDNVWQEF
jgi:hypothetical protein